MPTGSLIPHLHTSRKPMPFMIYITWLIFGFKMTTQDRRTYIYIETNRKEYLETMICLWHGRNPFWCIERGNFTEVVWKITGGSMHWVWLAHILEEKGFPWAKTTILCQDIIECQDALIEGSIFGIKSEAVFSS